MTDYIKYIIIYLTTTNLLTFILFAIDKYKAIRHKWRIRESVLLLLSLAGGAIGGYIAMILFRHKTQTAIFKFGVPTIILLHIALAAYLLYK